MRNAIWGLVFTLVGCGAGTHGGAPASAVKTDNGSERSMAGTFGADLEFLRGNTELVVLRDAAGQAQVAVAPEYQGRVMTSTASGERGPSFGFVNREVIAAKKRQPHMNVFGGEDRFWLGPEGGQYGLYFPPGAAFDFEHWQVPAALDWGPWPIAARTSNEVRFDRRMELVNHSGVKFQVRVERSVTLLERAAAARHLGTPLPNELALVAYESRNQITNVGSTAWVPETGLLSIWILGMYQPSPETTIVIPFKPGSEAALGPVVNDAYFGKVPSGRLRVTTDHVFFRGDGRERGKIGVPERRALPVAGSYDASRRVLTIVEYTRPAAAPNGYVNSMWEQQTAPYAGDVVNSYNDGPPEPGKKPLGPFFELETSSPAAALAPGASVTHVHRTIHVQGAAAELEPIARAKLGVGIHELETALESGPR